MEFSKSKALKIVKELAIIFFGVVLALAGERFVQHLNDRSSEKDYLTDLLKELEVSKSIYVDDRARYHQTDSAALKLIQLSASGDTAKVDICYLIGTAQQLIEPDIYKSVYEDLMSTGNLTLITNSNLRQMIIQYYQRELYEEKWANNLRDNLSRPNDKWSVDLLTVDEFSGATPCNSKRILTLLKQKEMIVNLERTRKMAIQNGRDLEGRIYRTADLMEYIKTELSK